MTADEPDESDIVTVSPARLARDLRSADDRDLPSRTDVMGAALSGVVGGPVGRHAMVGRAPFLTPFRVMLLIALVFLGLGYTTKAPCLVTTGSGTADQRVANWQNQRAYYEFCYSDTVPLYTAELLNLGKFPYKSSWIETDSAQKPRVQYDGTRAVRYMEYPVLTGMYQYASMSVAKTYTALSKLVRMPVVAEVIMFFNISAFGLALAWLATVWATMLMSGRRPWDAAIVAGSPILIFQAFTNFDALATACAAGAMLAWSRRKPVVTGLLIGVGVALKLYPLLLLIPLAMLAVRTGRWRPVAKTAITALVTWIVVNLPIMLMYPRGWSEFFRLNTRRGDDMDSLYNVVKSFTGWSGFDTNLGFWEPPTVLNTVTAVLFVLACAAIAYVAWTAPQRPRLAQLAFLVVAAFLLTNKVWSPQYSLWLVPLAAGKLLGCFALSEPEAGSDAAPDGSLAPPPPPASLLGGGGGAERGGEMRAGVTAVDALQLVEAVESIERRGVGEHRLLRRDQHVDHVVGPQLGQWIHRLGSYPLTVTPTGCRRWPA